MRPSEFIASADAVTPAPMGRVASLVGRLGAWFIDRLIAVFGRTHRWVDVPWLAGPFGGNEIGDAPYAEVAAAEQLTLERRADGGLLERVAVLESEAFASESLHPLVRKFYERTARFGMDVWSETFWPMRIGLWLMVTTLSRMVNQLNFPLSPLETARGLTSEVIHLRRPDGTLRYTGWFRTLAGSARVLYTGFYTAERIPGAPGPCVKVAFPMPHGNATVCLRPGVGPGGSLVLDSSGRRVGDPGFYRLDARGPDHVRVWYVRSLTERFHVFVDAEGTLRCDHHVRFLGMPVLRLHYKMVRVGS